jgi:UDP-N-acetylmuramoyl-tripeptide--D-alanyl-D-alanine ligase
LSFTSETEIGIVEMGAKRKLNFGEVANPDYGYITNFGKAHPRALGRRCDRG